MKKMLLMVFLSCFAGGAHASSVTKLKNFMRQTQSAQAEFTQTVLDKARAPVQQASGTMAFARPGKFRWTYAKPYEQQIVGDGAKLWVYDTELNQVSVKDLDQALGNSPAALLAGSNEIEKAFNIKDIGQNQGLEWLEATAKTQESNFDSIRMGFNKDTLEVMELKDNFGQTTVIRFSKLKRNPRLNPTLFKFTPPKGVDIIGS